MQFKILPQNVTEVVNKYASWKLLISIHKTVRVQEQFSVQPTNHSYYTNFT